MQTAHLARTCRRGNRLWMSGVVVISTILGFVSHDAAPLDSPAASAPSACQTARDSRHSLQTK